MPEIKASGSRRDENYVRRTAARYKEEFEWADEDAIRVSVALNSCYNAERLALSRFYDTLGLARTAGRFTLLRALYFAEKRTMTPADIADQLMVTQANISYLLDGLEREELVVRAPDADDRRVVNVTLTEAGKAVCDKLVPAMPELLAGMAEGFTLKEKQQFLSYLLRYLANATKSYA